MSSGLPSTIPPEGDDIDALMWAACAAYEHRADLIRVEHILNNIATRLAWRTQTVPPPEDMELDV